MHSLFRALIVAWLSGLTLCIWYAVMRVQEVASVATSFLSSASFERDPHALAQGSPAKAFTLPDARTGHGATFSGHPSRMFLLIFGSSSCQACASMAKWLPHIVARLTDSAKGVDLWLVWKGSDPPSIALELDDLPQIRILMDPGGQVAKQYQIHSVPYCYLIRANGTIGTSAIASPRSVATLLDWE